MIEENECSEPATPLFLKVVVAVSVAMTVANVVLMKIVAMGW